MLTDGVDIRFQHIIQHLIQHQSHAAAVDVTMDTDMDKSLRDRLVRMLIRNNVERGRGGEGGKLFQLHLTFAKRKEMLNGC